MEDGVRREINKYVHNLKEKENSGDLVINGGIISMTRDK
jgi:hypothetical protein